jgi:hypothetical protein
LTEAVSRGEEMVELEVEVEVEVEVEQSRGEEIRVVE